MFPDTFHTACWKIRYFQEYCIPNIDHEFITDVIRTILVLVINMLFS
jgi:hypothetical protein